MQFNLESDMCWTWSLVLQWTQLFCRLTSMQISSKLYILALGITKFKTYGLFVLFVRIYGEGGRVGGSAEIRTLHDCLDFEIRWKSVYKIQYFFITWHNMTTVHVKHSTLTILLFTETHPVICKWIRLLFYIILFNPDAINTIWIAILSRRNHNKGIFPIEWWSFHICYGYCRIW